MLRIKLSIATPGGIKCVKLVLHVGSGLLFVKTGKLLQCMVANVGLCARIISCRKDDRIRG